MTLSAGNVTRMVASYSYDDIGRLVSLKRSGNAGIVNYAYNIRNWLKEAKSDRFCQNLLYENTGAYPCFNGNISRMQWQTSKDNVLRGYDFAYDGLNRLEESTYVEGAGMSQNKNRYSENILSYSPNGSIERLQRYGKKNNGTFGLIDDLMYSYNGNQIKAISDKAGSLLYDGSFDFKDGANADVEYFYDTNGALIKDLNKGISNIEYDVLSNLMQQAISCEPPMSRSLQTRPTTLVTSYSRMASWISIFLMGGIVHSITIRIQLSIITRRTILAV